MAAARVACRTGHRLPATAVVLSPDESFAVTVSKDGSIIRCGGGSPLDGGGKRDAQPGAMLCYLRISACWLTISSEIHMMAVVL